MGTAVLRPNGTLVAGPGGSTSHTILSDSNASTSILCWASVVGSSVPTTPASGYTSVALADSASQIPTGRTITRVRFAATVTQYADQYEAGSGAASLRYADGIEVSYLSFPLGLPTGTGTKNGTATKYSSWFTAPPVKGGSWTTALVDGLKVYVGAEYGATGSANSTHDVWIEVDYTEVPSVPSSIQPANASILSSNTPTLSAALVAIASGQTQKAEWQIATDTAFTTNLRTITESDADLRLSGATSEVVPLASKLSQRTWYVRARAIDQYGLASAWTAYNAFAVAHVPQGVIVSPTGGKTIVYTPNQLFDWSFTDAWAQDTQSAYQLIVENASTGAVIYNSGETASSVTELLVALSAAYKDIPLRWKIAVWDSDAKGGGYSSYAIFTVADNPTVVITAPSEGGTVITGSPTFTWTFAAGGSRTQTEAILTVRQVSTNAVVWSATIAGAATSITPPTTILVNNIAYSVTVEVTDSAGLKSSDTNLFTTSYVSPDPIEYLIDSDSVNQVGYVDIDWSGTPSDSRLTAWRVYRRVLPSSTWELLEQITDAGTRRYRDYMVKSGLSYMYSVTQVADRSGTLLESPVGTYMLSGAPTAEDRIQAVLLENYWMLVPDRPELTMLIPNVTDDPSKLEFEDESYNIIGRGRHWDYGDELGVSGTITFQIRQPEITSSVREDFEELRRARETYVLRTPFGRLIQVAIGDLDWKPLKGTGLMEMGDMSFSYSEVK